ncbi:hypothetical protein Tco_0629348 [Tanacetum coccineum]|uniref:Reverse transcriptase Ty1/copia-type domain-containing protein n=1 Tax=Tanacetum coccineum TaxID=301880 RepID=A0ABQ4WSY1_9ASTR
MYRIATTTTQNREPQLPHASRNTNPHVSKSSGVNPSMLADHSISARYQVKDKVVTKYNSQVKFKKKEVEDHHRISSISKKTKSVTACNDSSNSRTSNVNAVCDECGKCVFNSNHDACVSRYLNDVNARTKKPNVVPISASKTREKANKSVRNTHKKTGYDLLTGNRGTEFLNKTLHAYFKEEGIEHQTSTSSEHFEQNGVVSKDGHRTLVEASATTTAKRCLVENVSSGLVPQGKKASDYRQTLTTLTQDKMLFLTTEKKIRSTGLEFLLQSLLEEYYNPTTNKLRKKQNIDQTGCIVFNEDEFINLFMIPVQDNWWSLLNATFDNTVCGIHFNHKVMITMDQSHPLETSSWKSNHAVQTSRQPLPQICKSSKGTDSGEGIDFEESFAQFDRLEAVVRIFVAPRSTQKGWVRCPDHPERSLPLRSFYGLKQAQESWPTYALEILKKHNMDNCHSIGTPLATKPKLDVDLSGEPVDQSDYRSKIGSLMYLTSSRPDLVQAWYAMCTLSSTANTKASKEDCTAMSSAEAEYVALSTSYAQVMWMRTQLKDYGSTTTKYRVLFDSSVSHSISMQPVTTSYEHSNIHTRYHFIGNRLGNINPMIQPESEDLPWIIQKLEIAESLEHPSDTNVFTMKMEILLEPASNKLLVEPTMVAKDDEMSKEKEIDKLMALISLSFKKIYKPTNNNLRTLSNTSRAHQDNTLRINRGTGYNNQRAANVAGARKNIEEVTSDVVDNSRPIFDTKLLQKVQHNDDHYNVFANDSEHPMQPESVNDTYLVEQDEHNIIIDSLDMSHDREQDDQDDNDDLAKERDLLASLITKLKCEIDDSKNRNKLLESSNKILGDKLTSQIKDFKNKNACLESSNTHIKEANNDLKKTNQMMFKDLKNFQDELEKRHDVNYMSKVELDCAKEKTELMSYKTESQKSINNYSYQINDLNQKISDMKKGASCTSRDHLHHVTTKRGTNKVLPNL